MEQNELDEVGQDANEVLARIISKSPALRDFLTPKFRGPKGEVVEFELRGNQSTENWVEGPRGELYCWTPWKATNGWYYAWTYKPYGKGSRSGNPTRWRAVDKSRYRKRKLATRAAYRRYIRAGGRWAERCQDWIDRNF